MKIISEKNSDAVKIAGDFLRRGKIISFATDTVYGIAVDASNIKAVEQLYKLKKRDPKKPIAIFVQSLEVAKKIFFFDKISQNIAEKFLPGKLTLVLKQRPQSQVKIAKNLNYDAENFLGFRVVDRNFIKNLLQEFDGVLAVTSANLAGENPAQNASEVAQYFTDLNLDLIIDGGSLLEKNASTVVKIFDEKITILRHGAIAESLIMN